MDKDSKFVMKLARRLVSGIQALIGAFEQAFAPELETKSFVKFLHRTGGGEHPAGPGIVLIIVNKVPSHHIGLSQAAPIFARANDSRLVGFFSAFPHARGISRVLGVLVEIVRTARRSSIQSVYRAFGVAKFITPSRAQLDYQRVHADIGLLREASSSKSAFERASIRGILIGDLIYDQYLVELNRATLDLNDPDFWRIAERAVELLHFFESVFEAREVRGVFGNNAYLNAIPNRIALARGIPVYEATSALERTWLPDEPNYFQSFPDEFRRIKDPQTEERVLQAKNYLSDFVAGKPVQPLFGHTFASFLGAKQVVDRSDLDTRPTILVAPHNPFTDSPHAIGYSLFPDYAEWLDHLGDLALSLDYRWLLKVHPDERDPISTFHNRDWIDRFIASNPSFILVPAKTSHASLISEGIDAVLTVSGSIGFEYAACGIPVINASVNNPHAAYSFTWTPRSLEEYDKTIRSVPLLKRPLGTQEVAEFFFMRMYESVKSPFIEDLNSVCERLGGVFEWDQPGLYLEFMTQYGRPRNVSARDSLKQFFDSGDRRWYERHRFLLG